MNKVYSVYKITCKINNKVYIGQTYQTLHKRFTKHMSKPKEGIDTKFYRAIRKYGKDNFYIELIEEVETQEELDIREYYWINYYNSVEEGYNSKNSIGKCGGDTLSNHPNREEISNKISKSKLGDKNPMRINGGLKGEKNGMYGKTLTEEHKAKMSLKLKGQKKSDETKLRMSKAWKGVPKSEEHKENALKSMLGDEYYKEIVLIDKDKNIVNRFKNKSDFYKNMPLIYNVGRSFLENWIKNMGMYTNPKKLKRMEILEGKELMYYDEYCILNV